MLLGPYSYRFVIATPVLRVEVDKGLGMRLVLWLPPYLPEHAHIRIAHQHLPQNVEAVSRVDLHDVLAIDECAFLLREVVIVVPMQGFAEEILRRVSMTNATLSEKTHQTMQMM